MLGSKKRPESMEPTTGATPDMEESAFGAEERSMVSGVLTLGARSIRSIMTPRTEISWLNLDDDPATILQHLRETPHGFFPVYRGQHDALLVSSSERRVGNECTGTCRSRL